MLSEIAERIKMPFDHSLDQLVYAIPFVGVLLSLSLLPLLIPSVWHNHYGKITLTWAMITIGVLTKSFGMTLTVEKLTHTLLNEYLPFVILIGTLFIISGGIHITMRGQATPWANTQLLAFGSVLASFVGTTGAAMLLIRPLINLNKFRRYKTHLVVFFIFSVANIGGILTPLGDPPLFLGFLNGVPFFWPMINLWWPLLAVLAPLLVIFYLIDHYYFFHDPKIPHPETSEAEAKISVKGKRNFILLLGVIFTILLGGIWNDSPSFGFGLSWADVIRDLNLIILSWISWMWTPGTYRNYNHFSWEPFQEVAKIFFAIFVTIMPVIEMLHAGVKGPFAQLLHLANPGGTPNPSLYFWLTGWLSAFLDNAPTYLVFFHMAGGNPYVLTGALNTTLVAVSCGAVFMGAMTYVGNAPNFMIKAIAERAHIKMPTFFGYIGWSMGFLFPLLLILSYIMF
jgi:Na+/H+ antiporter NhaD/arsenite permease-like protein